MSNAFFTKNRWNKVYHTSGEQWSISSMNEVSMLNIKHIEWVKEIADYGGYKAKKNLYFLYVFISL